MYPFQTNGIQFRNKIKYTFHQPIEKEFAMQPVPINDQTFENEVLQADGLVLVDFWAPWCAPCRMVAPVLEELAREYAGRVKIVKLNTDENQAIARQYNIRSIPTLKLFRNGKIVDEVIGAVPKHVLSGKIDYYAQAVPALN